jgi:hypothetical protein
VGENSRPDARMVQPLMKLKRVRGINASIFLAEERAFSRESRNDHHNRESNGPCCVERQRSETFAPTYY